MSFAEHLESDEMLKTPWVMAVLIICGTLVSLGLLGVLAWLIYSERDAQTILALVNLFITAFLWKRVGDVDTRAARVEQQTNGNTTKILDAALGTKPSDS